MDICICKYLDTYVDSDINSGLPIFLISLNCCKRCKKESKHEKEKNIKTKKNYIKIKQECKKTNIQRLFQRLRNRGKYKPMDKINLNPSNDK